MNESADCFLVEASRWPQLAGAAGLNPGQQPGLAFLRQEPRGGPSPLWTWLPEEGIEQDGLPGTRLNVDMFGLLMLGVEQGAPLLEGLEGSIAELRRLNPTWVFLGSEAAEALRGRLAMLDLTPPHIRTVLEAVYRVALPEHIEAVEAAAAWLRVALAGIEPGRIGVLTFFED